MPDSAGTSPSGGPQARHLFALVGGDLAGVPDSFVTKSGRKVALGIYVEPGKEDRCGWAKSRAMRWTERFGLEYDLDVFNIASVNVNMGAMENKGLNIFNDSGAWCGPTRQATPITPRSRA